MFEGFGSGIDFYWQVSQGISDLFVLLVIGDDNMVGYKSPGLPDQFICIPSSGQYFQFELIRMLFNNLQGLCTN